MDSPLDVVDASRRLSDALQPGDLDATLQRITTAAVEVIPDVSNASITVKHSDGTLGTVAQTDESILVLDAAQYELQEGPCYEAATDTVHVTSPDIAEDDRFPRYARIALASGVRAQAGIRLFDTTSASGALNLYSERRGAFSDLSVLGALFTHHAAVALAYARQITQLQEAVKTRQLIGQAVGLTMGRYELDDARAFGFLTRLSQDNNVKLRTVAQQLIEEANQPSSPA